MSATDLVRARVADGPWGPLLGALAARGFSGEVAIEAAGKRYALELRRGVVVSASSPLASDAIVRVALTSHLVTPVHIATITRALAAAPGRDEIDVVAEIGKLTAEQATLLRARAITQRAARTFSVDEGEVTIRAVPPAGPREPEIPVGAVIFLGARMHLSEVRLANDLRALGGKFALAEGADALLPRFGFGAEGAAVAMLLRGAGTSLAELEAAHREIDPRVAAATVYALVSCGAALATAPALPRTQTDTPPLIARTVTPVSLAAARTISEAFERDPTLPRAASLTTAPLNVPRTQTPPPVAIARTPTPNPLQPIALPRTLTPPAQPRTRSDVLTARDAPVVHRPPTDLAVPTEALAVPRATTPPPATFRTPSTPPPNRTSSPALPRTSTRPSSPALPRTTTPRWTPEALAELAGVVGAKLALIDQGADYFSVLGLVFDAPIEAVRAAHAPLARVLVPEALAAHATPELQATAARLREHVTAAFDVLTDPSRRMAYVAALRRGGDPLVGVPRTRTEEERSPLDEALHRGMLALRANQPERAAVELARAVELEPGNVDHGVLLAWARFCAATDKGAVAHETRKVLVGARRQSEKPQLAVFYLGRVERMLGRDKEALAHFQEAAELDPANLDAAAEVRVLEARLANAGRRR